MMPNHDNLVKTLLSDSIGRNEEIYHLIRIINAVEGAYSIAIDGRWGSGKTFFVRQAKMVLDAHNEYTQIKHGLTKTEIDEIKLLWLNLCKCTGRTEHWVPTSKVCVYINAWEYDNDENPIASLLYQISKDVSSCYSFKSERNYLEIASSVLDLLSGKNYKNIIEAIKTQSFTDSSKECYELREQINEYFNELLPERGERLILFVDELDRCNPSYAVALLEKIKHYFDNDKITFVFSVNLKQLQHTIRQHYGNGFDAYKYLDRFFDITIPMPSVKWKKFYELSGYDAYHPFYETVDVTIKYFNMEMREVSRYLETLRIITSRQLHDNQSTFDKSFCYHYIIPVALALYKNDLELYEKFVVGEFCQPLVDILSHTNLEHQVMEIIMSHQEERGRLPERIKDVYNALFIKAKNKESQTIGRLNIRPATLDCYRNTIGILNRTSNTE